MKIAWFAPSGDGAGAAYADRLLAALAAVAEVGVLVDRPGSARSIESCAVHDLSAVHYRNVLFRYDVAVYVVSRERLGAKTVEAFCEWPGVVIVGDDVAHDLFMREPTLARALRQRMLAVVVHSPSLAERLLTEDPWTPVFRLESPRDGFDELARALVDVCRRALDRTEGWLETLLESACAELPGSVPGDRDAAWRAEVDELSRLVARRSR